MVTDSTISVSQAVINHILLTVTKSCRCDSGCWSRRCSGRESGCWSRRCSGRESGCWSRRCSGRKSGCWSRRCSGRDSGYDSARDSSGTSSCRPDDSL
ncbi:unnamed protein product [Rotaria sp. Silwood1]|nr:unnamed protein product [Rotaria sp. Silwood1]